MTIPSYWEGNATTFKKQMGAEGRNHPVSIHDNPLRVSVHDMNSALLLMLAPRPAVRCVTKAHEEQSEVSR